MEIVALLTLIVTFPLYLASQVLQLIGGFLYDFMAMFDVYLW